MQSWCFWTHFIAMTTSEMELSLCTLRAFNFTTGYLRGRGNLAHAYIHTSCASEREPRNNKMVGGA